MPWTEKDTARHNKTAAKNPKKAKAWAEIATKALGEYKNDGTAIRVANAAVKNMRGGGAATRGLGKGKVV